MTEIKNFDHKPRISLNHTFTLFNP